MGFRFSVKQLAAGFDVTGWVRNLADGTVELRAVGEDSEVDAFSAAITASHLGGYIRDSKQQDGDADPSAETGFQIRA